MSKLDAARFRAASEAAEGWLNTVALIAHLGRGGNVDAAMRLLMTTKGVRYNLLDDYNEHVETLDEAKDKLAALSDAPIKWKHGRGLSGMARVPSAVYPHVWSSAHEASEGIARLALSRLASPVGAITDPTEQRDLAKRLLAKASKALAISTDEVADLQERIRRERAKLLNQAASAEAPQSQRAKRTGRPRKGESDKERLVISALDAHHKSDGSSVENPIPAKLKHLANLASNKHVSVSVATVSRFFARKFPGRGYKGYEAACIRNEIALRIAGWQGDISDKHLADLRPHHGAVNAEESEE
jgi:hypothetical protein